MAVSKKTELVIDRRFDRKTCRHTLNGQLVVLHCHHYAALYSQLADDCGLLDAKKLLAEVSEDTFYKMLSDYYALYGIDRIDDRISIAEQYYAALGIGKMKVIYAGNESGEVELIHSHVDEGWVKKWGNRESPVNFITCGYIAALMASVYGKQPRMFTVVEAESMVAGKSGSRFVAVSN
ncbi:MAG: hypothetical protein AB2L14_06810 [Candidatus Xenobiia bacterium LiM19]